MNTDKINYGFLELYVDYLYHLGIDTTLNLAELFADVQFAIFTRSNEDAAIIAHTFTRELYNIEEDNFTLNPLYKTERFHFYKIKNTVVVSAGIGFPSTLICLNEMVKLFVHANLNNPIFIHIGPAGGLGLLPGTLIINDQALNTKFESVFTSIECGIEYNYDTSFNQTLAIDLYNYAVNHTNYMVKLGSTMSAFDYYDEQARIDGFLEPSYTVTEQKKYLDEVKEQNIYGINMEGLAFAGFCNQLNIKSAAISVLINNRLISDRVLASPATKNLWIANAAKLCIKYIIRHTKHA